MNPTQTASSPASPKLLESTPLVKIRPTTGWHGVDWKEVWEYRELLYFLVWRDIKVRYKQTLLGVTWVILQPLLIMVVFSIFFGHLGKIPSDGIPYPIFAFTALLPWQLFSFALTQSSNSLVTNQNLLTKVYFPRILMPMGALAVGLVDFSIAFLVLIAMMAYYRIVPTVAVFTLPLLVLLALVTALGVGLWLAAVNVLYRDVRYALPFLAQIWMFATPIAYPSSLVPEHWRWVLGINPMTGVVEAFRWSLLGRGGGPGAEIFVSAAVAAIVLISGLWYFRRIERRFADVA